MENDDVISRFQSSNIYWCFVRRERVNIFKLLLNSDINLIYVLPYCHAMVSFWIRLATVTDITSPHPVYSLSYFRLRLSLISASFVHHFRFSFHPAHLHNVVTSSFTRSLEVGYFIAEGIWNWRIDNLKQVTYDSESTIKPLNRSCWIYNLNLHILNFT